MRQNPEMDAGKEVSFHRLHEVEAGMLEVLNSQRMKIAESRAQVANNNEKLSTNPYTGSVSHAERTERSVGRFVASDTSDMLAAAHQDVDQAYLDALEDETDVEKIAA